MTVEEQVADLQYDLSEHFPGRDHDGDYTGQCDGCGWTQPDWEGFWASPNNFTLHLAEVLVAAGWRKSA